jgi:hypothetical protein
MINPEKKIGVWMDHQHAFLIELKKQDEVIETVNSEMESQLRYAGESGDGIRMGNNRSTNNEHHRHQREQDIRHSYFKKLEDKLKKYDDIYLFGSSTAKDELFNLMKENAHFDGKMISVETADEMTENQMVERVKDFFNS